MADVKVCTVVIGDGRLDLLRRTVESYFERIKNADDYLVMVNDTGDSGYARVLADEFPQFKHVDHSERRGLGGAVKSAWTEALKTNCDYIFHLEEDFIFPVTVDVLPMTEVLAATPNLAQLMLKRQPVNDVESRAGGVIECAPDEFHDQLTNGHAWVKHSEGTVFHGFGYNPFIAPRSVLQCVVHSNPSNYLETNVSDILRASGYVWGYWGAKADPPTCITTGANQRSPGYRW